MNTSMKREIDRAFKTMMVATAVHKKQHIKHYIEHMCIFASGAKISVERRRKER